MTESGERQSKFVYLLNAMENAAQSEHPYKAGYPDKRAAVLKYVADLEVGAAFEAGRGGLPVRKANDPILDVEIYLERDELLTLIDACDIYVFSDRLNDVRSQLHRQLPAPPDSGEAL